MTSPRVVNIHEAKTHLSRLVERAAAGEEIVIGRAGRPIARLVPYRLTPGPRRPGLWKGRVRIAKDFDTLPPDVAAAFEGRA
jgi:prevent-host-death family protein